MANGSNPGKMGKAAAARLKAERGNLHKNSGKFKTGPNQNPATKRLNTRSAAKKKSIGDFKD